MEGKNLVNDLIKYRENYIKLKEIDEILFNGSDISNKLLSESIELEKGKSGNYIFKESYIVDRILVNYDKAPKDVYEEVVKLVYSSKELARTVIDGYANGGNSFLLMTLWNRDLKLSKEQKDFAISEAQHKFGTKTSLKAELAYEKKLEEKFQNGETMFVEHGGTVCEVDAITGNLYNANLFKSIGTNQAHGNYPFDIRMEILANPNFENEFETLLDQFFYTEELYEDFVNKLEWAIINSAVTDDNELIYNSWDYDDFDKELASKYLSPKLSKIIVEEINFVQKLKETRYPLPEDETEKVDNEKIKQLKFLV